MNKAELEAQVNAALKNANEAIDDVNNWGAFPDFPTEISEWMKVIKQYGQTSSGEKVRAKMNQSASEIYNSLSGLNSPSIPKATANIDSSTVTTHVGG